MAERETCPQCGVEFVPSASPLGLCPACLLKLGASDPSIAPSTLSSPVIEATPAIPLPSAPRPLGGSRRIAWIAGAVLVLVAATYGALRRMVPPFEPPAVSGPTVRFQVEPPDGTRFSDDPQFAVSPDGLRLVVVARQPEGRAQLWVRWLQSMEWNPLPGTEGATLPFWSPDSRRVGFFADRKLKSIDASTGLALTLADAPAGRGGSWSRRDVIVFAPRPFGPLFRVAASGGTPEPATATERSRAEESHAWPHFLPDGDHFVFVRSASGNSADLGLFAGSLSGEAKQIASGAGPAVFAQGFLLLKRGAQLAALPFDPRRMTVAGDAVSVAGADRLAGMASPGFSADAVGVLVHAVGDHRPRYLIWHDRVGRAIAPMRDTSSDRGFSISPDGRRVALARSDNDDTSSSIWIADLAREVVSRLTLGRSRDRFPVWSPDGQRLAFATSRDGAEAIYAIDVTTGKDALVERLTGPGRPLSWSPDGRQLLYEMAGPETGLDLWLLQEGGKAAQPMLKSAANESDGRFSPDGRWIAYVSDESGDDEVYVRGTQPGDGRQQISYRGGTHPRWRRDGHELFYVAPDARLMSVAIQMGALPATGRPEPLLMLREPAEYEVAPDGQRFLTAAPIDERQPDRLQVILNWAGELRVARRP